MTWNDADAWTDSDAWGAHGGLTAVGSEIDLRWAEQSLAGANLDGRWSVAGIATVEEDLRWGIMTPAGNSLDSRWSLKSLVGGSNDLRWALRALAAGSSDLRWQLEGVVGANLDARWALASLVWTMADLRWAERQLAGGQSDLRWQLQALAAGDLDVKWQIRQVAGEPVINLITNPAFGTGVATWVGSNANITWVGGRMRLTAIGAGDMFSYHPGLGVGATPVRPNKLHTLRASFEAVTTPRSVQIGYAVYDAGGALVTGPLYETLGVDSVGSLLDTTRQITTPGNAAFMNVRTRILGAAIGEQHDVDLTLMAEGVVDYFDGDTTGAYWLGTPHASQSEIMGGAALQWSVVTGVGAQVDSRWVVLGRVTSEADLRWKIGQVGLPIDEIEINAVLQVLDFGGTLIVLANPYTAELVVMQLDAELELGTS